MDPAFTDITDVHRADRDVRVTVRDDEVTLTIRSPKKFLSITVDRAELVRAITGEGIGI
ncbi:hypothetical protein [Georgenia ruanii]|uniref:hypothetical protein n=1 Tax=Georgenia ruanii TaxID=348442 RepID=UPI00186B465E|nr:hypothetical protein [Georgenia ruanii]